MKKWPFAVVAIFITAATLTIIILTFQRQEPEVTYHPPVPDLDNLAGYGAGTMGKPEPGDNVGAWAAMQMFVKRRLVSPKSADFPFGGVKYHVTDLGDGRYLVKSYVDSQNVYGANLRTHFEGVVQETEEGWELEYLNFK
jgi:hypothetical protein